MAEIDHLVYVVADLEGALDVAAQQYGTRPAFGGRHASRGTHNALLALGGCYLELIAADPDQPDPDEPRPFGIDDRDDAGFVAFAVRPAAGETLDDLVTALRAADADPGAVSAMSRSTPSGDELHWRLTFPTDDATLPFLIDWGDTPKPHTTAPAGPTLTSLVVRSPDPLRTQRAIDALAFDAGRIRVEAGETALIPEF